MTCSSAPVVGRSAAHIFPQVVRITLPDGVLIAACCIQDSSRAHERVAQFVEALESVAHLSATQFFLELKQLAERESALVSLAVARLEGEAVMIATAGDGAVLLQRKGSRKVLLNASEFRVLGGVCRPHDVFFTVTGPLLRVMPNVSTSLSTPTDVADELGILLANPDAEFGAAGVIAVVESVGGIHHGSETKKPDSLGPVPTQKMQKIEAHTSSGEKVLQQAVQPSHSSKTTENIEDVESVDVADELEPEAEESSGKKRSPLVGVVLGVVVVGVLVLGGSVWLGIKRQQAKTRADALAATLQPIEVQFADAKQKSATDVVIARTMTQRVIEQLRPIAANQVANSPEQKRANALLQEVSQFAEGLSEEKQLTNLTPFFDLRLINPEFRAAAMTVSGDTAYIVNSATGSVYSLNLSSKRTTVLEPELGKNVQGVVSAGNTVFAYGAQGIQKNGKSVFPADDRWKNPGPAGWYMGNFYLADSGSGELRKFTDATAKSDAFQGGESWLKSNATASISDWVSLAIDGRIWVGTKQGEIRRYLQGNNDPFSIIGLDSALSGPVYVAVANTDFLYVLEPAGARLLILKKTGQFVQTYKVPAFADARAFAVSQDGAVAYVVTDTLVYKLPLE